MKLFEEMKSKGWFLKEQFVEKFSASNEIISCALNMDLREIGAGALTAKREDTIPGRIVLQIMKVRNIGAPKAKEDSKQAPRLLLVDLSDGQITIQALDLEFVSAIDLKTIPGTKIYFRPEKLRLMQGFIILRSSEIQVLGGNVPSLVEKWEFAQSMKLCTLVGRRSNSATGPPSWVAFDKMSTKSTEVSFNERNFKSLKSSVQREDKVNEEFTTMRSEAIDQANKIGVKKVFGGGNQKILDHNVKNITSKGFSEQEAKEALRTTNNNLERALYNLKRGQIDSASEKSRRGLGKNYNNKHVVEEIMSKPISNGSITLYDFLKCEGADKTELQSTENTRSSGIPNYKNTEQRNEKQQNKSQHIKSKVYGQRPNNINDTKPTLSTMKKEDSQNLSTARSTSNRKESNTNMFYDSSKIIGFQNKETNDFASSVMHNQNQSRPLSHFDKSKSSYRPTLHDSQKNVPVINYTNPKLISRNTNNIESSSSSSSSWKWKIGDLCIAKYWDDGQYYDAQITAISENTCVVLFLNYGNHEEVLKNDLLPVTDRNQNTSEKRTNVIRGPRRFRKPRQTEKQ